MDNMDAKMAKLHHATADMSAAKELGAGPTIVLMLI